MKLLSVFHSTKRGVQFSLPTKNQKQNATLISWSVQCCLGRGKKMSDFNEVVIGQPIVPGHLNSPSFSNASPSSQKFLSPKGI